MNWVLLVLVFGFGVFAAFRDVDDFFTTKSVGHLALRHRPTLGFLFFNGALSVGFLAWALFSPAESAINRALLVEDPWLKSLVVGLGVPSLLKSKLFGGNGSTPIGISSAYEWVRIKVLRSLNSYSSDFKDRIAEKYASKLQARQDLPELLREWVRDELTPFDAARMPEIEKEFEQYKERKSEWSDSRYLQKLIRWALDKAGIPAIRRRLDRT